MWDFQTEPEFQRMLDWADEFVTAEVEPLDLVVEDPYAVNDPLRRRLIPPLQQRVREHGLWACHLGPELGGAGYGQLKLALLNEILGRSTCAPTVFGCQAPDSGNSEILARFGTDEQRERWLRPLLANEIVSAYAMTEPQGGADPAVFTTSARWDGEGWAIDGEKWFVTNASNAAFLILLARTEPDAPTRHAMSMFIIPAGTPGLRIVRNTGVGLERGRHAYLRLTGVRVPADSLLGRRGEGFQVAQVRLGGGRIHHAMRTVALVRRSLEMMCERALSRTTKGGLLARKQLIEEMIADSWTELECFRLLVLRTAWRIDAYQDYEKIRGDISAVKAMMPRVLRDVAQRALQVHGSLGVSTEMPFLQFLTEAYEMGLADGPTEVHKGVLAREVLAAHRPTEDLFPRYHLPTLREAARKRYVSPV